ncbi:prepilin peptidase [Roseisolibacter agri]|uniref:prepilin peptidase n=1 Tax=Roseisolibacter agri TaxID=2014610 RepID=UPI0024E1420C|nr:prepilin peptidase [Roseisolibacter agri]
MRTLELGSAVGLWSVALRLAFVGLLMWAAISDLRARRIPNALTGTLLVLGLVGAGVSAASGAGVEALRTSGLALGLGCAIWMTLGFLGLVAFGDVKLFAAASAWLTPTAVVNASLWAGVVGGVLAVLWAMFARGAGFSLARLRRATRQSDILHQPLPAAGGRDARTPYGVSMVAVLLLEVARLWNVV